MGAGESCRFCPASRGKARYQSKPAVKAVPAEYALT